MTRSLFLKHSTLDARIVRREMSCLAEDIDTNILLLKDAIAGSRCLFIGASGSIGSNTLKTVLAFEPASVHVIDHNENGLAELVRDLRSGEDIQIPSEFVTLPFDYGGPIFKDWYDSQDQPFDHILNFAALKHVRSEKDPYSILAMLDTNVVKLARLQNILDGHSDVKRLFCVSTDKAANPSSMMGATKRLMEHALFSRREGQETNLTTSSARFANVALSNGSLLQSWEYRLRAGQPLACPKGCSRYFVSLQESGHLCTLAAFATQHDQILIPNMQPEENLVLLENVVQDFLTVHGYKAVFLDSEAEVKAKLPQLVSQGKYPVLLTPLDTSGEKPYEEFVAADELLASVGMSMLKAVEYLPPSNPQAFPALLEFLNERLDGTTTIAKEPLNIEALRQLIATVEPAFLQTHRLSQGKLDERM